MPQEIMLSSSSIVGYKVSSLLVKLNRRVESNGRFLRASDNIIEALKNSIPKFVLFKNFEWILQIYYMNAAAVEAM